MIRVTEWVRFADRDEQVAWMAHNGAAVAVRVAGRELMAAPSPGALRRLLFLKLLVARWAFTPHRLLTARG